MKAQRSTPAVLAVLALLMLGGTVASASTMHASRVLYSTNWRDFHRWVSVSKYKSGHWSVHAGSLTTDGIVVGALLAPITMKAGRPYTVESRIRLPLGPPFMALEYGIVAAATAHGSNIDGIWADIGDQGAEIDYGPIYGDRIGDFLEGPHAFNPGSSWHLLRLSVRGSSFIFSIDGKTLVTTSESDYRNRPRVGVFAGAGVVPAFQTFRVLSPSRDGPL